MSTNDPSELAKRQRSSAKGRFTRLENQLLKKMEDEPDMSRVDMLYLILNDLKDAWRNVNDKHELYIDSIHNVTADVSHENEKWIEDIQDRFYDAQNNCNHFKNGAEVKNATENSRKMRPIMFFASYVLILL